MRSVAWLRWWDSPPAGRSQELGCEGLDRGPTAMGKRGVAARYEASLRAAMHCGDLGTYTLRMPKAFYFPL
jgi:hypothetical protein